MMETDVSVGLGSWATDVIASCSVEPTLIVLAEGLMGVTGREWSKYQRKTELSDSLPEKLGGRVTFVAKLDGIVACADDGVAGGLEKGSERGVAGHVRKSSGHANWKTGHECNMHEGAACGYEVPNRAGSGMGGTVGVSYSTPHAGNSSRFFNSEFWTGYP